MNDRAISDFFQTDYCQYSSYDNARKIASVVDGLKMSARKVVYTVIKNRVTNPKKVNQLIARVAEETQYLHGEAALGGVIVGMAQDFAGSNNVPLLRREGNFGNRLIPAAAAGRYIYTAMEDVLRLIFVSDDDAVLVQQEFEGDPIEPRFFVPTVPMVLVNGAEALSTGFSQKILPRNPKDVVAAVRARLDEMEGKPSHKVELIPWFRGFEGTVKRVENAPNSYLVCGKFERVNTTVLHVTEVPAGVSLDRYTRHLDKLETKGIIKRYDDLSSDGKFEFKIYVTREFSAKNTDDRIMAILKLSKGIGEVLVCNDEHIKVTEYASPDEIVDHYMRVKLEFLKKRKQHLIEKLKAELVDLVSRFLFIRAVVQGNIVLNRKSYEKIAAQVAKIPKIAQVDGSYEYLLRMQLSSLTKEKYEQLAKQIRGKKDALKALKAKTEIDIWREELDAFQSAIS